MNLLTFYDRYHQKNARFSKLISRGNFTYFYILRFLHEVYDLWDCSKNKKAQRRILDVGCGVGTISLYLANLNKEFEVVGVDVSPRAIGLAKDAQKTLRLKNVEFRTGELKKPTATEKGKIDLVTCFEVIEHVADQDAFLELIWQYLKPGGKLVMSTPSSQNMMYRWGVYRQFDQEVGHLRRYSEQQLRALLTAHHFRIQAVMASEGLFRNILFTQPKLGWMIRFLKGPLVPLFHALDRVSIWIWGPVDWIVRAEKMETAQR